MASEKLTFRVTSKDLEVLPVKAVKALIDESWWGLLRVCEGAFYREIHELVEQEERAEKQHRGSRRDYVLSVNYCARLFAVQHIFETPIARDAHGVPTGGEAMVSWADVGTYAPRVVAAYSLGARFRTTKLHFSERVIDGSSVIVSGTRPVFEGETYGHRVYHEIVSRTGKLQDLDGSAERRLLQKRAIASGTALHLPAILGIDYATDCVRYR